MAEIAARLRDALESGAPVAIDSTFVEAIDAAGIQLLCAVTATAAGRQIALAWTAVSPTVLTVARQLGAHDLLALAGYPQSGLEWFR